MEAIILDGEQKSALATMRSLSKRGVRCIVGSSRRTGMALHSRFANETFVYTSPLENREVFVNDVLAKCFTRAQKPVLFSFSDASFLPLAQNRELVLKHVRMALPPEESVEIAFNKAHTMELALRMGIPIARTYMVRKNEDFSIIAREIGFPVVVKPQQNATWKGNIGTSGSVVFSFSISELKDAVNAIQKRTGEFPILEEYIVGSEYGVEVMAHRGNVVQWFAHKRIRSLSPTGGASVVKESILVPHDLMVHTKRLIKELAWHGPAMVEFKQNSKKDNEALLLEINGRFWGSLPLAIQAGVDFPTLYAKLALGEVPDKNMPYEENFITRYLLGDVKHLLSVLFSSDKMRSQAYPSRFKTLWNFFTMPSRTRYDVLSLRDPLPFFADIVNHLL